MKKLYTTLALAAAVALSAGAATNKSMELKKADNLTLSEANIDLNRVAATTNMGKISRVDGPLKAAPSTRDEVLGVYSYISVGHLTSDSGEPEELFMVITAGTGANDLLLEGFTGAPDGGLKATFDPATKSISIPGHQLYVNHQSYGPVYFEVITYFPNEATQKYEIGVDSKPIVAKFDNEGAFTFPTSYYVKGETNPANYQLVGLPVFEGTELLGWFELRDELHGANNTAKEEGWVDMGNAEFTDGWILSWITDEIPSLTVKLQKSTTKDNTYRLLNPYSSLVGQKLQGQNEDGSTVTYDINVATPFIGEIVFNLTSPKCVLVEPGHYSGMNWAAATTLGWGYFCNYNTSGYNVFVDPNGEYDGFTLEEAIAGEILINNLGGIEMGTYDAESGVIIIPDCEWTATNTDFHSWQELSDYKGWGEEYPTVTTIILPDNFQSAISNVIADQENAPVEYFNLQGIRVNNPENGVFIRKQGTQTIKVRK